MNSKNIYTLIQLYKQLKKYMVLILITKNVVKMSTFYTVFCNALQCYT